MLKDLEKLVRIAVEEDVKNNPSNYSMAEDIADASPDYLIDETVKQIYNEIYSEVEEKVKRDLQKSIKLNTQIELRNERISDFRDLALSGFFVALTVGLLVNQLTEIIDDIKAFIIPDCKTIISSLVLGIIIWAIFRLIFSHKLKALYDDIKDKTKS